MNKDTAIEYLPLVQALSDGKVIQVLSLDQATWKDAEGELLFSSESRFYRVKPEPRTLYFVEYDESGNGYTYVDKDAAIRYSKGLPGFVGIIEVVEKI